MVELIVQQGGKELAFHGSGGNIRIYLLKRPLRKLLFVSLRLLVCVHQQNRHSDLCSGGGFVL